MRKFWTEEKNEIIREKIGLKSFSYTKLANLLGCTEIALKSQMKRLGIKLSKTMMANGYYSESELLNEAKKRKIYLTRDILLGLRNAKLISTNKTTKNGINYYNETDYNFVLDLFSKYELLMTFHAKIKKIKSFTNRRSIHSLIKNQKIITKKFENTPLVFISLESSKFLLDLFSNYITLEEIAKETNYTRSGIYYMVKNKIITTVKYNNKHYVNKKFIIKIKDHYEPRKNQYG